MKTWTHRAAALGLLVFAGVAQAALVNRGGGMIYDTVLNITWLADMNYAVTSGYAAANAGGTGSNRVNTNGTMGWDAANTWANNLVYGGYDDWRLASLNAGDTTCSGSTTPSGFPTHYFGTNCTGGELSHLFVTDLGNKADESVLTQTGDTAEQIANLALFSNVQSSVYWSGTEFAPDPIGAWHFSSTPGVQYFGVKFNGAHALAVRPGDVAVAVPEPQTWALSLLALGAAAAVRRRRAT